MVVNINENPNAKRENCFCLSTSMAAACDRKCKREEERSQNLHVEPMRLMLISDFRRQFIEQKAIKSMACFYFGVIGNLIIQANLEPLLI